MTHLFDARLIADALGGEIVGPNQVRVPGPGHSKKDRSLSVKIEPNAPHGMLIHSFSGDDFQTCLSYIQSTLGISCSGEASAPEDQTHNYTSIDAALRLWNEAEDARGTLTERYLQSRGLSLMEEARSAIRFHPTVRELGGF
jgi:putative DNA primase/helicase